jgi:hypothetical protein
MAETTTGVPTLHLKTGRKDGSWANETVKRQNPLTGTEEAYVNIVGKIPQKAREAIRGTGLPDAYVMDVALQLGLPAALAAIKKAKGSV